MEPNQNTKNTISHLIGVKDLLTLFGILNHSVNQKVKMKVKDLEKFDEWLYIISNLIVVKVYVKNDEQIQA